MTYSILMCVLGTALHIPSLILRYIPFKNIVTKRQKKLLDIIYMAALVLSFIVYILVDSTVGAGVAYFKINLFLFCVLMTAVNIFVIKNHLREHLFVFGVVAISILLLFTLALIVNQMIGYQNIQLGIIQTSIILIICFFIFYVPLKKLIIDAVTPFLNIDARDYWNYIWFIPVAMFLASFFAYPVNTYMDSPLQYLSRIMIGGATLFVCRSISSDYSRFFRLEIMGKQIELQKQYYNVLSKSLENDRRARHDFKHHISALRGYVDADDRDGLMQYCNTLEKENHTQYIPMCGNAALDGLLYHYMRKSKENNIDFSFSGSIEEINISDIDLCVLFGNALNNAFEAAMYASGKRFISVAASIDNNFLVISVDNSFDGQIKYKGEKILSRKRENSEGIGISSMKRVCEKYNGSASFKPNGDVFQTGFVLSIS